MQAIALTDFVHGDINAVEGKLVTHRNGGALRQALAEDLERAGLIRIKADAPAGAKSPEPPADTSKSAAGKALDDGAGQPSSASPAAPVSPITTSTLSKPGAKKAAKKGR